MVGAVTTFPFGFRAWLRTEGRCPDQVTEGFLVSLCSIPSSDRSPFTSARMQSQLVCNGCRTILLYPRGATNVRCAICNTMTPTLAAGIDMAQQMEMAQIICCGCRTLLMYTSGATSVRCSCCGTINIARPANQNAYLNCGQCHTTLIYPYGAPSVKCAVCHFVTNAGTMRVLIPEAQRPNETIPMRPSTSAPPSEAQNMTVVVENPMSVNQSGKLVSNVVVGVTTGKK
ncbi:hypothetical protein OPV22_025198 [Ensete ventricosum]|uniref:Zinc finger LSD1-type domain-containing protein n=2 Tax=Ensete ventricosum TaxID=4639 RepID=A0AAV8QGY9_ENSVE|nr:hypothetical protein OPV22_025198 [Ensete ventricosum]